MRRTFSSVLFFIAIEKLQQFEQNLIDIHCVKGLISCSEMNMIFSK